MHAARTKTAAGETSQRYPRSAGRNTAAIWLMVKATAAVGRDIARIGDFLEIGLERERQREQQVIHDIERGGQHHAPAKHVDAAIGHEDQCQPGIFEQQRRAFAIAMHRPPHQRRADHVGHEIDQEQRRDLMHLEAEFLDHHEAGEHHEYLPPCARHELQGIVEPVPAAQHHALNLRIRGLELRIDEQAEQRDQRGKAPGHQVDGVVAEIERLPRHDDQHIGHKRRARPGGDQPAQNLRRAQLVDPLQLQRLVDRFVIVKTDRAEHRNRQDAAKGGELRRQRRGHPQKQKRDQPEHLFAHEDDDRDHPDGQKARYLAHRMQPADIGAIEPRGLDHEIIEQRRPCGEGHRHGGGHQEQQGHGAAPERQMPRLGQGDRISHADHVRPYFRVGKRRAAFFVTIGRAAKHRFFSIWSAGCGILI